MKKLFFLLMISILIFSIYKITNRKSNLFFSIGNTNGDFYYNKEDMHISEVKMGIEQNEEIHEKKIQYLLVKSSRIQIDCNAFFRLTSYDRILTQIHDLEELIVLIRKYCKEKIEIILLQEQSELADYSNKKISILCQKYDIIIKR